MTIFITVQNLNAQKHSTDKYAIAFMYFADIDDKKRKVKTLIIKEIHLIDNLKTNMLIDNDILKSEFIDISTFTKSAYVDNCEITIFIWMQVKTFSTRSVCAMKSIVISSLTELTISIHKIDAFNNDYIFEFDQANFFIYAHVINANIKVVLIRNDNFTAIKISRNLRLEKIIKMNYSNVCLMNFSVAELILRRFKIEHKQFYWNKILKVYNFAVSDVISSFSDDTVLFNEVIIYNSSQSTVKVFFKLVQNYFILWNNHDFANLSEKNWMRIFLKTNWKFKIKEKIKMYSVEIKNKEIIDKTFNKLHDEKKLSWITDFTSFSFSCFVVWKNSFDQKKKRVVVNIRSLNTVTLSDVYFISLQIDIIQVVSECQFISIIDCAEFFYQWRIHSADRHKLIVVSHREQEIFNVIVMRFRNSFFYVQRQINRVLRLYKNFSRTYIDDIMIFFKIEQKHIDHLQKIFNVLTDNNIIVNSLKTYIEFFSIILLSQRVTSLNLSTNAEKLRAILNLIFSRTLEELEIYFKFTKWFK